MPIVLASEGDHFVPLCIVRLREDVAHQILLLSGIVSLANRLHRSGAVTFGAPCRDSPPSPLPGSATRWAIDPVALDVRRRARGVFALREPGSDEWLYPGWQFEDDGNVTPEVERVLAAAREAGSVGAAGAEPQPTSRPARRSDAARLSRRRRRAPRARRACAASAAAEPARRPSRPRSVRRGSARSRPDRPSASSRTSCGRGSRGREACRRRPATASRRWACA